MSQVHTQPLLELNDLFSDSDNESSFKLPEPQVQQWGHLLTFIPGLPPKIPLTFRLGEKITIGRMPDEGGHFTGLAAYAEKSNDPFVKNLVQFISRKHFIISRAKFGDVEQTILKDISQNGTYVDRELVGKDNEKVLANNSTISIGFATEKSRELFIYVETLTTIGTDMLRKSFCITSKIIGSGAMGTVYLAQDRRSHNMVAMKVIGKKSCSIMNAAAHRSLQNELDVLRKIQHPCCIRFLAYDENEKQHFICMECATGGEYFDFVTHDRWNNQGIGEKLSIFYSYQLCLAIDYLHGKGIAHRDLKPENVLLASDNTDHRNLIKVADFGLSKMIAEGMQTFCGTPQYLAPEIVKSKTDDIKYYTQLVDLWSIGVIIFITVSGYPPFSDDWKDKPLNDQIISEDTIPKRMKQKIWSTLSANLRDFVCLLLQVKPSQRMSAAQALRHPWLSNSAMAREERQHADKKIAHASDLSPPIDDTLMETDDSKQISTPGNIDIDLAQTPAPNVRQKKKRPNDIGNCSNDVAAKSGSSEMDQSESKDGDEADESEDEALQVKRFRI